MDYDNETTGSFAEVFYGLWHAEDFLKESRRLKAEAQQLANIIARDEAMLESLMWMLSKKERLAINIEMGIQKALYVEKMKDAAAMQLQYFNALKGNQVLIDLYRDDTAEDVTFGELLPVKSH